MKCAESFLKWHGCQAQGHRGSKESCFLILLISNAMRILVAWPIPFLFVNNTQIAAIGATTIDLTHTIMGEAAYI